MHPWRRIERFFKHHQLRFLEKVLGVSRLTPADIDQKSIKKILVVRQHDQLGDFLLSTPVFKALRRQYPHAYIAVVTRKYTAALMRHDQYIDEVLTFYENGRDWRFSHIVRFIKLLRQGYDLAIVLNTVSHSLTSDLIARFSGAQCIVGPEHLKFKGTQRNFFYHIETPWTTEVRYQGTRNLDVTSHIGVKPVEPYEHMTLLDEEKAKAREELQTAGWDGKQTLIAIHPGAGKLGNRWPVASFAQVGNELAARYQARLLVSWGPGEKDLGESLLGQLPATTIAMTQPDIRKFAAMISCANLFLCNDTGVMHVAAAVDVPLVAAFGPTDPAEWKPFGLHFVALNHQDKKCASVAPKSIIMAAEGLIK